MKYKYFVWAILILLINTCCHFHKNDSIEEMISFSQKKEFDFSNTISNIRFLPLELTDESSFMSAHQILFSDNYIVIFDFDSDKLLKFNNQGKFICRIGNRGQGPYEYSKITSVCIKSDTLFISDNHDETLIFDLATNKFVGSVKYFNFNIIKHKDSFVGSEFVSVDDEGVTNQLYFYDNKNNLLNSSYKSKVKSGYMIDPLYRFYNYDGRLFYYPPYENAIYEIKEDSCFSHITFDFGVKKFNPISIVEENTENQTMIQYWRNNDEYIHSFRPFETSNNIIVNYWCANINYVGIWDRVTRKGFYLERNKKDNIEYTDFMYRIKSCKNDTIVATTNMKSLRNLNYYKSETFIKEFLDKNTSIDNDSEVLVFFTLK